ncbi:hypothetical protein IQ238_19310 [Pleurocapsales cyanobacterium LEGE 06147]|nr:hypothetical protein [Pleurocapsales cyanobacterium LEGE 06147]
MTTSQRIKNLEKKNFSVDEVKLMIKERSRMRTIIMGAAGRDFHNFNMVYRNNPQFEVVAFTAAQISGIAYRQYPPSLAGSLYLSRRNSYF